MIRLDQVSVTYPEQTRPTLRQVDLCIPEGELALVVGQTGAGKSTLLRTVAGLVPHFSGGRLTGRVVVGGRDTRTHPPRELADVVGVVGQDPRAGFVTDTVEDELAYGMECLGLANDVMRRRVEETVDLLGLDEIRGRSLDDLSAGQQQRVALGAVLAAHPRVLVLDEPTSALDPGASEEVLAALTRLVHDLGITVLLAEHRLERVVQYADRVVLLPGDGTVRSGPPTAMMLDCPVAPPVVRLGRLAGWSPLPLSVRDARRASTSLQARLARLPPPARAPLADAPRQAPPGGSDPRMLVEVRALVTGYAGAPALRGIDLEVRRGERVAVMGRNGAGKSTLLASLVGLRRPWSGRVRVLGQDPRRLRPAELVRRVGLVPAHPTDLLYRESVNGELASSDTDAGVPAGTTATLFANLARDVDPRRHPRDLSEGQRLALALAVVLASAPPLLLLDEPTRGLDYEAKSRLVGAVSALAAAGHAIVLASHDVELVAEIATRVVVLAQGEVVTDGPVASVVTGSPVFAPQVAKVLSPEPWLTVDEVSTGLSAAGVTPEMLRAAG
ncbi:MAG: ABC transporter ATP-binding protein [Actinomycetes bacterium]